MTEATGELEQELAALAEYGIGCPRAVSLKGPGAVADWCAEQRANIEAAEDEAATDYEEAPEHDNLDDDEEAPADPPQEDAPAPPGREVLDRLDALDEAVDALANQEAHKANAAVERARKGLSERIDALQTGLDGVSALLDGIGDAIEELKAPKKAPAPKKKARTKGGRRK